MHRTVTHIVFLIVLLVSVPAFAETDSDLDGLPDSVETDTGVYIDASNTGTDPNNPDTDGDGVGDWYEVAASFTSPLNPADKPNMSYPLPDPDPSDTGLSNKPVKVYILAGQSNMEGYGRVSGSGTGTLATITLDENRFPNLVTDVGGWTVRNDVYYRGVISDVGAGALKADVAGTSFGPELGFGQVMGQFHDEPVLLIKASKGAQRLGSDILPPGSPSFDYGATTYGGYGDSPYTWPTNTTPIPTKTYAGRMFDTFFLDEADWGHPIGWNDATNYTGWSSEVLHNGALYLCIQTHTASPTSEPGIGAEWQTYWRDDSVDNVTDTLDNFAALYPQWAAQGFEIAGFVWWQGHTDQWMPLAGRYEQNLVQLIKQLRIYYSNRYPAQCATNAPFVLATLAYNGWDFESNPIYGADSVNVLHAQLAVSGETGNYTEFYGNVKTAEARGYWRTSGPDTEPIHYYHNAETYMLVGDALGRGMVELLQATGINPPEIATAGLTPADNQTNVAVNANLVAIFNENIALTSNGTITVKNLDGGLNIDIDLSSPDPDATVTVTGPVLTIDPVSNLTFETQYSIHISTNAIQDLDASPKLFAGITNDATWNFTTRVQDTTPPHIILLSPTGNATGVEIGADLVATFSEPIALSGAGTITITDLTDGSGTRTLTLPTNAVSVVATSNLLFNLSVDLEFETEYEVTIDSSSVQDQAAIPNAYTGTIPAEWTFTTRPPDTVPPHIILLSPTDNATGVEIGADLVATFSEPIALSGAGTITITDLTDGSGTRTLTLPTNLVSVASVSNLTINSVSGLETETEYEVTIDGNAVQDQAVTPNAYAGTAAGEWTFTTAGGGIRVDATTNLVTRTWVSASSITKDLSGFNPSGSDKLVAVIFSRATSDSPVRSFTGATFNGVPMSLAVQQNRSSSDWRELVAIFYLDKPPAGGDLVVNFTDAAVDIGVCLLGVSGTATGYGPTNAVEAISGTITTTKANTLVIAAAVNALDANVPHPQSPLNSVFAESVYYCAGGAGYYEAPTAGDFVYAFDNPSSAVAVAAAFLPKPPPAGMLIIIR